MRLACSQLLRRSYTSVALIRDRVDIQYGKEITLYTKGFLSKGETVNDYHLWLHSHNRLVHKHNWHVEAKGWNWNCGDLEYPIPFITGTNVLYSLYKNAKFLKGHPAVIATSLAVDFGIYMAKVMYQYYTVEKNTTILSYALSAELERLAKKYGKVRVVAHSLGCKLLINAIMDVPMKYRPHHVHLCAPAFDEETYGKHLNELAQKRTYVYYSPNDVILAVFLQLLKGGIPIGSSGLRHHYPNVKTIDVSPYFKNFWLVHNNYNEQFHQFAHVEHETKIYLLDHKK